MEIVDSRGGLVEQRRVAEIPLGHFPLAAGEQCCVDMQFKMELEVSLGLVLANSPEDTHEGLGG